MYLEAAIGEEDPLSPPFYEHTAPPWDVLALSFPLQQETTTSTKVMAASAAKPEEVQAAKAAAKKQGTKPVQPDRRIWRPKVASKYEEPDCFPDATANLEILYKNYGKPLWVPKERLPPRDDIVSFNQNLHQEEFNKNIQWQDCPEELRPTIQKIIEEYWDVFMEEGVRKPIRGALFHVDTGQIAPVCTRPPRYGPHETRVINELVAKLEANGIIEDDDGPWGAPIVLAAKPHQEHVHWSQYTWRLCVSYRKLNAVTRPFTFPIIRCDDAVKEIGNAKYFITMDLDSGYWQVACEERSKAKLAFFTPTGKKRWKTMPMGATNAHPVFVALVAKFKEEWDAKATAMGLKDFYSQVIVDDIMICTRDKDTLLKYFVCVLQVLLHYRCTAKLRKCRFFPSVAEFVGLDIHQEGNSPAKSKFEAFRNLKPPITFTDLNMLIGCFGFYQEHIPLYEVRIRRWRETQKQRPLPGTPKQEEKDILAKAWEKEDDDILEELKNTILSRPILRRPDSNARFYLKTDWSKHAMGAALLQPDTEDPKAKAAMEEEIKGGQCKFDRTKSGLRLHPIAFISRRTAGTEQSYHSYIGEACTGIWAIEKFRPYLFGREFTWLTDCSGLRKFFEGDEVPTHMVQRWRMQLLRYDFTIVHRPGRMMFECDMLSRYNMETEAWRQDQQESQSKGATQAMLAIPPQIPFSNYNIRFTKGNTTRSTIATTRPYKRTKPTMEDWQIREQEEAEVIANTFDTAKEVWLVGGRMATVEAAMDNIGVSAAALTVIEEDPAWRLKYQGISWEAATAQAVETEQAPDWLVITSAQVAIEWDLQIKNIMEQLAWKGLQAAIFCFEETDGPSSKFVHTEWCKWLASTMLHGGWGMTAFPLRATQVGACIDQRYQVYILGPNSLLDQFRNARETTWNPQATPLHMRITEFKDCIDKGPSRRELQVSNATMKAVINPAGTPCIMSQKIQLGDDTWWPVFSDEGACPNIREPKMMGPRNTPITEYVGHDGLTHLRHLQWQEVAKIIGVEKEEIKNLQEEGWNHEELINLAKQQPAKQVWEFVFANLKYHEQTAKRKQAKQTRPYQNEGKRLLVQMATTTTKVPSCQAMIDRWTTIPLPTHKTWSDHTAADGDLRRLMEALRANLPPDRHRLVNKQYFDAWDKGQLEEEDGILYHTVEPRLQHMRQLWRRVVPKTLRHVIITAYHATPLAGHSGMYRTYWRVAARYWWPGMNSDVKEAVTACAHCRLANATGHEEQQILTAISSDTPFDVIALDVWSPGDVTDRFGNVKALTSMDTMTGFASVAVLRDAKAETVARTAFASFFVPNGLPKLILVDAGSENKGMLLDMCRILKIKHHMVAPENHNGVLCERFHRYLNKVQRIGAANSQTFAQWAQGVSFAAYSWNAAPIDGTNLVRSFVAKGRDFPFPLQIAEEVNPARLPPGQGEEAIAHLETNFPLWAKQSVMLQTLIAERRERHREMRNNSRKQREFQPGDLVIIRKQVQSQAAEQAPAKQKLRWKGIYKVLAKEGEKSYLVQKQPTIQGQGVAGRILKYSAAVMERIPSSVVVHKHLDTTDTRLTTMDQPLVSNPLEHSLGLHEFGKYVRAPTSESFVFDKVEDLWEVDLEPDEADELHTQTMNRSDSEQLYKRTQQSKDKLFIIQLRIEPQRLHNWYIVKVDWENTDALKAQQEGIYHCIWLIPRPADAEKRPRSQCRYWPEVHQRRQNGQLGKLQPVDPGKISQQFLTKQKLALYAYDTNLLTDALIGPFNFTRIEKEPNRIDPAIWQQLLQNKTFGHIDRSNVHEVKAIR